MADSQRLRTDRKYNLDLVGREDCDADGWPIVEPCYEVPRDMTSFNYAKTYGAGASGVGCHLFVDDYQFERVWTRPLAYVRDLRRFQCVCAPDFSLYADMPEPVQRYNHYRSLAVARIWQTAGLRVVPTLQWSDAASLAWSLDGVPRHSVVAASTNGCVGDARARRVWREGMERACSALEPAALLVVGQEIEFDRDQDIEVAWYANHNIERCRNGRKGRKLAQR